jgi:hypothetical protein
VLLLLLGLPGLYAAHRARGWDGWGGGFLDCFLWHLSDRGDGELRFPRPGFATPWPAVLDSINQYLPVVIINMLAEILFMVGYIMLGVP